MLPDSELIQTVRTYVQRQKGKSREGLIAFNEGVMAASFALGAFIDGGRSNLSAEAMLILETAYESMTRVRAPAKMFPPQ